MWELGEAAAPAAFIAVVYALASAVVTHGRAHRLSFATVMAGIFSAVLLPAAFACLARLRAVSPALALTPFIGAFMSDTGAFFAGRAFGKHKLAPAVSPHKTVEGSVGGFIGSVAGMLIFHYAARAAVHLDIGVLTAVLLGLGGQPAGGSWGTSASPSSSASSASRTTAASSWSTGACSTALTACSSWRRPTG